MSGLTLESKTYVSPVTVSHTKSSAGSRSRRHYKNRIGGQKYSLNVSFAKQVIHGKEDYILRACASLQLKDRNRGVRQIPGGLSRNTHAICT